MCSRHVPPLLRTLGVHMFFSRCFTPDWSETVSPPLSLPTVLYTHFRLTLNVTFAMQQGYIYVCIMSKPKLGQPKLDLATWMNTIPPVKGTVAMVAGPPAVRKRLRQPLSIVASGCLSHVCFDLGGLTSTWSGTSNRVATSWYSPKLASRNTSTIWQRRRLSLPRHRAWRSAKPLLLLQCKERDLMGRGLVRVPAALGSTSLC